jgi:hypothetical protein
MRAGAAVLGGACELPRKAVCEERERLRGRQGTNENAAKSEIHSAQYIYSTSVGYHAVYIGAMNTARPFLLAALCWLEYKLLVPCT